jgi:phospholipase/lecithinase/hemolysin
MKFLKIFLVALVFVGNLMIAQPSWAGKDFTKGTDYAEVTQALNQLQQVQNAPDQAGYTPEQYQQQLAQLQNQKYIMETAKKRAQCRNATGNTLAVYANKPKKSPTQLYFLGAGKITDDDWDCDGIYLPAGTNVVLGPNTQAQELTEPLVAKFVDGTQSVAKTNPIGGIELNIVPAKVYKAGEINWSIPTFSQADINAQTPSEALID